MLKDETGKPFDFSFKDIRQYGTAYAFEKYESFSQLLDEFYSERDRIDRHAPTLVRFAKALEQRHLSNKPQAQQSACRARRLRRQGRAAVKRRAYYRVSAHIEKGRAVL